MDTYRGYIQLMGSKPWLYYICDTQRPICNLHHRMIHKSLADLGIRLTFLVWVICDMDHGQDYRLPNPSSTSNK